LLRGKDPLKWVPVNRGRVLSDKNKAARVEFCERYKNAQRGSWVYGDSKLYFMYKDGAGKLKWRWSNSSQQQEKLTAGAPVVLHFYGFVSKGYKSPLYFVPPTPPAGSKAHKAKEAFASKHFIAMLPAVKRDLVKKKHWGPRHPFILDHARQHSSKASTAAMHDLQLQLVEGFPAQCWDINIIENVWGVLDSKLTAMGGRVPTTPDGWRRRVQRAWGLIDQASIDKLVSAVPDRMAQIVQQQGSWLFRKAK
jgi:hypothetical protein